ncbi:bromoperoxidase [Algicella marina]|uniref:Bromoperoxidase n=1 Tax=Algicella marina TaxID=2683284 RepID=A0A6P1SWT3_9RHOB|nr:bromoperoxidase [Algicella marina]QHQ34120.1 bromoperoxidase [Algicella marina]
MKLPFSEPDPAGSERAHKAKVRRDLATEVSRLTPQAATRSNCEEADHATDGRNASFPANFTKGLFHDKCGLLAEPEDYTCFVEAINSPDHTLFEKHVTSSKDREIDTFSCKTKKTCCGEEEIGWRGWESPRAGHVYELEGPDAGAVGMAPAPRVGSSELAAEMAEVYGLALLRDVPFTTICAGGGKKLCEGEDDTGEAELSAADVVKALNGMKFYSGKAPHSSTPHNTGPEGFNAFERHRRWARTQDDAKPFSAPLTPQIAFRGSTKGALKGPYISQFMLIGSNSLACAGGGRGSFPGTEAAFDLNDGFIPYGSLTIDQRTLGHKNCLDYMTDWTSWRDVQNGASFGGSDQFEEERRFITTPRDLATYVHYDALYEAYLNAALILIGMGVPSSKGFPEPSPSTRRAAFATFGGPHVLSLVTEVATRCLKAVRRQKFNYHRRARPEAIAGRLTLAALGGKNKDLADKLGCASGAFEKTLKELPEPILKAIAKHNTDQQGMAAMRGFDCDPKACLPPGIDLAAFNSCNALLPMAFPEGSPMHPAYGAGHATVAGGCVTMLKAFFEMFENCDSFKERELRVNDCGKHVERGGTEVVYVPTDDGKALKKDDKFKGALTIQGELDKLAANISIGRNMAGVHYYSDYYDSLRMGERIAVGILLEQAPTYNESMEMRFKSFDGDMITVTGEGGSCPTLTVMDYNGRNVGSHEWWLRHTSGAEIAEDL